ncbi:hypothetical protein TB2_034158 [Malus domestica]
MDDFILATEVTQSNAMVLAHHTKSPTATNQPTSSDDTNTSVKDESLHNVTTEESSYESHYIAPRQNPIRERHPPARLQDFVTYKPRHPLSNYVSYKKLSSKYIAFLCNVSEHVKPQSFK